MLNGLLVQFLANLLGTIAGGVVLYLALNKRIENRIKEERIVKLLKNLAWGLGFNWVKTNKISNNIDKYRKMNKFTASKYHIENLIEFLAQRPIPEKDEFPYVRLLALADKLEQDNFVRDSVFDARDEQTQKDIKNQFLDNLEHRKTEIEEFLKSIEIFTRNVV